MGRGGKAGRIFARTIEKLRAQYRATWDREWPHEDEYLKVLWQRAVEEHPPNRAGYHPARYATTLNAMREQHVF